MAKNVFGRQQATKKKKTNNKKEEQSPSTSAATSNFDGDHQSGPQQPTKVQWERVLYKKQPFPDNHTDEQFLDQLRTNGLIF
jgi:hypothetical protein